MPLNERDYMRHDYKYRKPNKSTNARLLKPVILLTIAFACIMAGIYMVVVRQPPPISVTSFATELNRYRVSNGHSILTFEESLNDRALQLAEKIDQTGKADTRATITHHLDFARSSGQLVTDISTNANDNDALLRSDISSAGFGMSNRTIVIVLE